MAKKVFFEITFIHILNPGIALMLVLMAGCVSANQAKYAPYKIMGSPPSQPADPISHWDGEGIHGPPQIEIHLSNVDSRVDPKPPGTRFEGTPMPYFMRVHNAIGMHEGCLPGYPASHGCIRLPGHLAPEFYHHAEAGTPVEIIN